MAKKKGAKKKKTGTARAKKLSVKKRPVKDLDARKGKSVKGGIVIESRALNFSSEAVNKLNTGNLAVKPQ
jgi:hypothetical protein